MSDKNSIVVGPKRRWIEGLLLLPASLLLGPLLYISIYSSVLLNQFPKEEGPFTYFGRGFLYSLIAVLALVALWSHVAFGHRLADAKLATKGSVTVIVLAGVWSDLWWSIELYSQHVASRTLDVLGLFLWLLILGGPLFVTLHLLRNLWSSAEPRK